MFYDSNPPTFRKCSAEYFPANAFMILNPQSLASHKHTVLQQEIALSSLGVIIIIITFWE